MPFSDPARRKKYIKAYAASHPEQIRINQRNYEEKHRLELAARRKAFTISHPGHRAEISKRWRMRNLTKARESARKHQREYRAKNLTKCRERARLWKIKNPKRSREYQRKYQREWQRAWYNKSPANKAKANARCRAWKKANPQKVKHHDSKKYCRRNGAVGEHSLKQWMARVAFYGWHCAYCRLKLTTKSLTKDHRIPLALGGSNWPANLVPACRSCNCRKRTKLMRFTLIPQSVLT